jgi:hypothetical protein
VENQDDAFRRQVLAQLIYRGNFLFHFRSSGQIRPIVKAVRSGAGMVKGYPFYPGGFRVFDKLGSIGLIAVPQISADRDEFQPQVPDPGV